ncbi:MAG: D-sedoheptulose 7-phosphate isomerase [Alphaproteobacteria bacterium]
MDLKFFFDREFSEHEAVMRATRAALLAPFMALCEVAEAALNAGNKIMFFGNGGSAADAQHLAAELIVRYKVDRAPLAAMALTTDSSTLTAGGNDLGYDTIFESQLRALSRKGDLAIGITTSGNSQNVLNALLAAKEIGVTPAALSGKDGGKLVGLADPLLVVPSDVTGRIQEMHIILGHMLCDVLEQRCGK